MKRMTQWMIAVSALACLLQVLAWAEDSGGTVNIKKWKADPVELMEKPDGKVVASKPAAALPMQAERTGQGWLKLRVDGKEYYVEASQARTDLKLEGKPKCENLGNATGAAASRGLGEQGCEP